MGRPKDLWGALKDKVSLIKATLILSTSSTATTSCQVAVLRATNHHPVDPPPDYILDDVLALGAHHRPTASAVVDSILQRLHRTQSAFVALKCLLTIHHILRRGSPVLKAQLSHHHLLNLSTFRDDSDSDTVELSKWVRWFAEVIQQTLIVSDSLGFSLSSPPSHKTQNREERITFRNSMRELNSLVGMVEQICRAPDSLHYQRISMVYEVMKLAGEDYRITLREIVNRVTEFGEKLIEELSSETVEELLNDLKRLEDCKEKVFLMFLNKKKSDGTWDSIAQLRRGVEEVKQRRQNLSLVAFQGGELTGLAGPPSAESKSVVPRGKRWLDVQWNHLAVNNGPR